MMNLVSYQRIDDEGLHIMAGDKPMTLAVDTIVICAGQEPQRELQADLLAAGVRVHLIGGADEATELDAKRAILQGTQLALQWGVLVGASKGAHLSAAASATVPVPVPVPVPAPSPAATSAPLPSATSAGAKPV